MPVHTNVNLDNNSTPEEIEHAIKHLEHLLRMCRLGHDAGVATRAEVREAHEEKIIAGQQAQSEPDPAVVFAPQPSAFQSAAAKVLATLPSNPAIPAPPVAAPVLPQPTGAVELDAAGHPWDERIHASSRAKIADGTWRQKRGVNAGVLAAVEAERASGQVAAPSVKPAPIPKPPAGAAPEAGALTFGQVVAKVQAGITASKVSQEALQAQCAVLGLASFPELAKRPDLFNALLSALGL